MALIPDIKVKTKTRKIALYTVLEVIAVLLICLVSGAMDWVHMKITFDRFAQWSFYESVIQKFIMYSCALLVGYFFKLEREELNNQEYYSALDTYRVLLKSKKDSFVHFIENIFNPRTKKRYIKLKAQYRLMKLDKRSKDEWKIEFNKALKSENGLENWEWSSPKAKKYADERVRLTKLASDQYIEENWEFISIKYPVVSPHVFTPGLRKNISPDDEYKVENQTAKDLGRVVLRKMIMTLLFAILLALFILDPSTNELVEQVNGWIVIIIRYIARVVLIIINFVWGLFAGKEMFADNFILPIDNRIRILKEYINWKKEAQEPDSYADKLIEAYENNKALKEELTAAIAAAEKKVSESENPASN